MRHNRFLFKLGTLSLNILKPNLYHCNGIQICRNISQTITPLCIQKRFLENSSIKKGFQVQCRNIFQNTPASIESSPVENSINTEEEIYKNSLKHPDFFSVSDMFTVEDLFKANVHLGHREGSLCSYMTPYIFGSRLGHFIIDLDQTSILLRDALNFTAHIAFRGGIILFVCRHAQHQILIEKTAEECKEYSHTRPYEEGTFTNSTKFFNCVTRLPDLVIFLSTKNDILAEHQATIDASKVLIPSVGVVDTNSDPRLITYPVPGNDDTHTAIKLYCKLFKQAILRGKHKRKQLLLDV